MANVSDESSNNKINIVTNVENNVTVTQPNIQTVTVKTGPIGPAGAAGVSGSDGAPGATGTLTNNTGASITGSLIVTGTVSASLVTAITGSFTHIKGNSPITIQDSVTFQQPVTGSIFSGSFVGDGTNITGVTVTLPSGLLSGSSQIATEISGAFASPFTSAGISGSFTTPSSSISARITTLENNPAVASGTVSSSLQITQLGFVTSSATASFVTNSQTGSFITTLPSGLLSGSAQIATEISGAFASPFTSAGITGSFNISSASFSNRVTSLEAGGGSGFTSAGISGSLGANATLIRSLTAVGISGSFVAPSASFSTRVTTLESGGGGGSGIFTDSNGFKVTDNNLIISSSGTKQLSSSLSVQGSGSAIFDVQGSVGQLFEVQDGLDGVLMSVNDISGIPILTVSSSGNIIIPNASRLIGTASVALSVPGVSAAFPFTGNALITGDLDITGSGDDIFKVRSKSGSLFSVDDGLDGILMSVNDISGLPLFEVNSSGNVEIHEGNVSGSSTSTGSFGHIIGDGSQLSNLPAATLPTGVLSGSAQIATEISGAFGIVSSSLASRIATVEDHEHSTFALKTAVSGAFAAPSASFSTRTTALESNPVFSASSISGSSNALSASFSTRVTTNTTNITLLTAATSSYLTSLPTGVLSGSAQIASNISGSFGSTSSSLAARITTNATNISTNTSNVSSNLTKINSLTAATASLVAETLSIFRQEGSPAPGTGATQSIAVTVADVNGENKYVLGGVVTGSVVMNQGDAYKFDQSDGTNDGHPFRFSTDEGGSSNYSTGVTTAGVPGQAGSYTLISVTATTTAPLYYYCSSHSGMGTGVLSIDSGSLISTGFAKITGSLIVSSSNVDFLQSTGVSGSFSGSFEGNGSGLTGIVNASTASFISSTFISASAAASGFGSGGGGSSFTAAGISGSFTAPSASFSTRVTTLEAGGTPTFIASGSTSASADPGTGVVIEHSGSTAFSVIGDVGTLFSVDDDLTGTLFSVNDISGIPQLEVSASGKVEVGKGPLIANTFETGSITNGSPSSPLQMTFPSGSSKQLFGVGGYHRASWDDGAADHIWFQDDNIRLSYDLSGVDIEGTITKDPKVGEIHIITIKDGTYSALDKQVSDGIFDLNGSFGSDNTDTYTFAAPKDPTWPYYRVTVSSTSAAHDSYFYAIVEKFI